MRLWAISFGGSWAVGQFKIGGSTTNVAQQRHAFNSIFNGTARRTCSGAVDLYCTSAIARNDSEARHVLSQHAEIACVDVRRQ